MTNKNYTSLHTHTTLSLLDSTSTYEQMIDKAKEYGMPAIAFTEHGNIYSWIKKKQYCDKAGIKYIHGCEFYMTENHSAKERDNYHVILLAKNWGGVLEINELYTKSTQEDHTYYKNRISFDEFLSTSNNIIRLSACLGGVLNKLPQEHPRYVELLNKYDFLEVHSHIAQDQIEYNKLLSSFQKPMVACGDFHEISDYKAECRITWKSSKGMGYEGEDEFDLVIRPYEEFREAFVTQGVFDDKIIDEIIDNTNKIADMVEDFELDYSFKFPNLYENAEQKIIDDSQIALDLLNLDEETYKIYEDRMLTELEAFNVLGMESFILFMSEVMTKAKSEGWATGPARGSASGSLVCYLLKVTDVDPIVWGTNFTRFINVNRISLPDIDSDWSPEDRAKVFEYIQSRFGETHSSYITTFQKLGVKKVIEDIGRAIQIPIPEVAKIKEGYADIEKEEHQLSKKFEAGGMSESDYEKEQIVLDKRMEGYLSQFSDIFYYYEGLKGTISSVGYHPAGMIGSPINITDSIGLRFNKKTNGWISSCDMKAVDGQNYVKYDILSLKTLQIIKHTYKMLGKGIPESKDMDWNDESVYKSMGISPVGLFQFEAQNAHLCLSKFQTTSVKEIALASAVLRPSCASFRDKVFDRQHNTNSDNRIDELLKDSLGFLVYQEDQIAFLQKMCGFTEGEADVVRRAIGKKSKELLDEWIPKIEEGYIKNSYKNEKEAKEDFQQFLIIFLQAVDYSFSYNHAIAYSMITYMTAYLRHYHPKEFITAYLNNASDESDIQSGTHLARVLGIEIRNPAYGKSGALYSIDGDSIYKGIESVLYVSARCAERLLCISKNDLSFPDLVRLALSHTEVDTRQIGVLIKCDFFKAYGKASKLFNWYQKFMEYDHRKTFPKETINKSSGEIIPIPKGTEMIIRKAIEKGIDGFGETAKQFKVDGKHISQQIFNMMKNNDFSYPEKIVHQLSYLGYIQDPELNGFPVGTVATNLSKNGSHKIDFLDGTSAWMKPAEGVELSKGDMITITEEHPVRNGRYTERTIFKYEVLVLDRATAKNKGKK